jgi:hypothetical protein
MLALALPLIAGLVEVSVPGLEEDWPPALKLNVAFGRTWAMADSEQRRVQLQITINFFIVEFRSQNGYQNVARLSIR